METLNKELKIKELSQFDVKIYLTKKLKEMLMDLKQKDNDMEFTHLTNRVTEIVCGEFSHMNVNEVDSCLSSGMANGFGNFRNLTVQVVSEWLNKRRLEFYQKNQSRDQKLKEQERDSFINLLKSTEGGIISLKNKMVENKYISQKTRFEYNFLRCLAYIRSGKSFADLTNELIQCEKTGQITNNEKIEFEYNKLINEIPFELKDKIFN